MTPEDRARRQDTIIAWCMVPVAIVLSLPDLLRRRR